MDTQQTRRRVPKIRFRVLIIGRANAGKTSILQRVRETTESPIIYRGKEEINLDPSMDRGEHTIDDEYMFSNHDGYVFHNSDGIESGSGEELGILQAFIRRKCGERRLGDRLHAIWFCVPMDNQRPELDLKYIKDICPDRNVPVIVVFTKYDQFRRNVEIDVVDYGNPDDSVNEVGERIFQEHYLHPLGDDVRFVRLEQMHRKNRRCDDLIERTAAALNDDIVGSMLLAVQRDNLELSVKTALNRAYSGAGFEAKGMKGIVRECLISFPYTWLPKAPLEFELEESGPPLFFGFLSRSKESEEDRFAMNVMSLPTIQNLAITGPTSHHLVLAVIFILKHAAFLRLSNLSPESALAHAELDYREGNIDLKIRQHLMGSSQDSVEQLEKFAGFIMATHIEPFRSNSRPLVEMA